MILPQLEAMARQISSLQAALAEEGAKRQFFEAHIRQQIATSPASVPVALPIALAPPVTLPVAVSMPNVVEMGPADDDPPVAAAPIPNVVEIGPVTHVIYPKDARIAALERKVELLTEAVVSLLAMKSDAEHTSITCVEKIHTSFPDLTGGKTIAIPLGPSLVIRTWPPPSGKTTTDKAEWDAAFEELQMESVKTDTLIAALTE